VRLCRYFLLLLPIVRVGRTRFGHIASRLGNVILGRHALRDVELIEDVRVDVKRHRRRVPGLARDIDHAASFMNQQRDKAVA